MEACLSPLQRKRRDNSPTKIVFDCTCDVTADAADAVDGSSGWGNISIRALLRSSSASSSSSSSVAASYFHRSMLQYNSP